MVIRAAEFRKIIVSHNCQWSYLQTIEKLILNFHFQRGINILTLGLFQSHSNKSFYQSSIIINVTDFIT